MADNVPNFKDCFFQCSQDSSCTVVMFTGVSTDPAIGAYETNQCAYKSDPITAFTDDIASWITLIKIPSPVHYTCPDDDQQTILDPSGIQYQILCGQDISGSGYATSPAMDFNDCFAKCSADGSQCTGVIYLGQDEYSSVNGVGPGTCAYKDEHADYGPQIADWVSLNKIEVQPSVVIT